MTLPRPSPALAAGLAVAASGAALVGSLCVLAGVAMLGVGCARSAGLSASPSPYAAVVNRGTSHRPAGEVGLARAHARPAKLESAVPGTRGLRGSDAPGASALEELAPGDRPLDANGLCPPDMASIDDHYCIDRYEGSLLEILPNGDERMFSPFSTVEGKVVRAISEPDVMPQGYISGAQAKEACSRSGKRLCKAAEWRQACMGPEKKKYGYSDASEPGRCNDAGKSPLGVIFRGETDTAKLYTWDKMNDPALNQLAGALARTGSHEGCANGYGVFDMVGNLHEWIDDPGGTFLGGYYLDTHINGDGCSYTADAHEIWYHDYSTGFRCCADVAQ